MNPLGQQPTEFLRHLAAAVDAKGRYFPSHSDSVAYILRLMALEAGFDTEKVRLLQVAALLHDTGKLLVPESVLLAERPLTESEWDVMKKHSSWSATIASHCDEAQEVVPWVLHHHERWDGAGYPDGLSAERIPLEARMLLVADAFTVITVDRPYRLARSRYEAVEILKDNAGSQFDPDAVSMLATRARRLG